MYLLANQWLKTTGTPQSGLASTFITNLDMPNQPVKPGKKGKEANPESTAKPKRDLSKVKCLTVES
jgi:hypothetical protein